MSNTPTYIISSVNMRKCNAVTHAMLNHASHAHLLLIQEPWYDWIGTARQDNAREGIDVLGGVASPVWNIHYPSTNKGQRPKVMAYSCKTINANSSKQLPFSVVTCPDICAHPCIQILNIIHVGEEWRVINVYHNTRDMSGLDALMTLDLDPFTPTLIMGDFNTHSRSRSPDNIEPSYWAWRLEEWAVGNLLTLANNPGTITHQGTNNERDSVLDLAWFNTAAIDRATFSNLQVDWEGSLGSDHTALHVSAQTRHNLNPRINQETNPGYLVEDGAKDKWLKSYKQITQRTQTRLSTQPTREEVECAAQCL